ncbi:transposase [Streptomyces litchfieldiae]|uniref:transposase n=1 Tax=Streptomyces litchfieldiae TaxID=3075543 RepID=UPI00374E19DF
MVSQSLFGTSDVVTVLKPRCNPRWKAACGLGLYDTAFDPSLLTCFRRRPQRSSEDSTVFDDAVATQGMVTQLISAVRRVIRA